MTISTPIFAKLIDRDWTGKRLDSCVMTQVLFDFLLVVFSVEKNNPLLAGRDESLVIFFDRDESSADRKSVV